jgi:hypothetical protein
MAKRKSGGRATSRNTGGSVPSSRRAVSSRSRVTRIVAQLLVLTMVLLMLLSIFIRAVK